jgi:hypothetical protein
MAARNGFLSFIAVLLTFSPALCPAEPTTAPSTLPSTAPAASLDDRPATLEQIKAADQLKTVGDWTYLPQLPPRPIKDVVHFFISSGNLALESSLAGQHIPLSQISFTDLPGSTVINVQPIKMPVGATMLMLKNWDYSNPKVIATHLEVYGQPNYVQVVRAVEYVNSKDETVSLNQNYVVGSPLTLRVQVNFETGSDIPLNIVLSAPSVWELRRQNPIEYEKYLLPMFRSFRQERTLFTLPDAAAWQVLADTWISPPDIATQVQPLIAELNADDYAARSQAAQKLRAMNGSAALYLMAMNRTGLSPEQNAQIDTLLRSYQPFPDKQVQQLRRSVNFLIDCLYSDDDAVRTSAVQHLSNLLGHPVQFDVNQSSSASEDAIRHLRDQLDPPEKSQ